MGGVTDFLFGSGPEQVGTASDPGQQWLQGKLQPLLEGILGKIGSGQPAYNVPQAPSAPGVPSYNVSPYQVPQAPYSSPMDMIQSGEMNTARNLREQFYGGGGGGSAMGGVSGQGQVFDSNLAAQLAQGAVGRWANMQLPYAQMQGQQARDVWGQQNNVWNAGLNQANLGYTMGQIPQWQAQAQAYNPYPWASMYSGTYGSPIVEPGQQGFVQDMAGTAGTLGLMSLFGAFSDIRLKKDIKKVGTYKGMDVIEFEYIWGGGRNRGLIAQQVREKYPEAVGEISGYLFVNYGRL
jgi:hypothetical protein